MKIKIPKLYLIGTLATTVIISITSYNIINANNSKEPDTTSKQIGEEHKEVQNTDYYNEIADLKRRLANAEIEIQNSKEKNEKIDNNKTNENIINKIKEKTIIQSNNTELENKLEKANQQLINIKEKVLENDDKNKEQRKLVEEKANLIEECKIYQIKQEEYYKINIRKNNLKSDKEKIKNQISTLKYATPVFNIENANKQIIEFKQKINLATNEKEKEIYKKNIETINKQIEDYKTYLDNLEKLENQLKEIENNIKQLEEQSENLKLSDEENKRYSQISSRIGQINEELLKY